MKKKLIIASIVLLVVAISGGLYYNHNEEVIEEQEQLAKEKANMPKPSDYCLITYQQSSDNGKNWHTVIINSGKKPVYKAQCWKKYIHILDGFKASINHDDGIWHSKLKDGKIIAHPSMHFSDKPFEAEHTSTTKAGKDTQNKSKQNN
ncbi:hypothetical protein LO80_01775 [Candidatus Francisella endociliophora]|uniref:Uncharacterized protein n=1 Tax=Candidatus Francisella endociliophora TaxID=653937 RepID=A0A097EMN2_9GAMM|nr:hypothetical protein [Francisella sp. FSC1006]AIT08829.1 hypothetical protein LO80_01775 [Francisella sp. FSC1006]